MTVKKTNKLFITAAAAPVPGTGLAGCSPQEESQPLPVRVLILPKFEIGEITGDFPGEAQFFYDEYLAGEAEYEEKGFLGTEKLYYKDGIAMFLLGEGKVRAALNTAAVLSDPRFDFSDAYILSVGCGGSAEGYGIFGDVYVISASDNRKNRGSSQKRVSERSMGGPAAAGSARNLRDRG